MLEKPCKQHDADPCLGADYLLQVLPADFFTKQGYVPCREGDRRRFVRRYLRISATLHLNGSLTAFPRPYDSITVYLTDLSRSGLGFICDRQFYPCEKLQLELPGLGEKSLIVQRSKRIAERCYEIGCDYHLQDT